MYTLIIRMPLKYRNVFNNNDVKIITSEITSASNIHARLLEKTFVKRKYIKRALTLKYNHVWYFKNRLVRQRDRLEY